MKVDKYIVLMCTLSCLCSCLCQLNLSEEFIELFQRDITIWHPKEVSQNRMAVNNAWRNAGLIEDKQLPQLPEICSYMNDEPVVCCTDCVFSENDEFKDSAIAPHGILVSRRGPVAWRKCLDYFQKLPYSCRGKGDVQLNRSWKKEKQCHEVTLKVKLAVGGQDPQRWQFPHLALLGYGDTVNLAQWLCEGTVISERFILTAAHCTNAGVLGNVAYAALGLQSHVNPGKDGKIIYNIKRAVIHPEYNEPSWYHDIALLEMEADIRFDSDILPACLNVGFHDISVAEAAGISKQSKNKTQPNELQMVYLDQLKQIDCTNIFKPDNNLIYGFDHKTQMCYAAQNEMDDTCKRISGSPLQIDQFKCQYTVVGVTSNPEDCGKSEIPDIYTRISYYVPWIEKIVWPED